MPVCRHCGSRISKFDKDRCPICGEINPLEGTNSDTIEITSQVNLNDADFGDYKPKRKSIFLILSILIGFTGSQFFYLRYLKAGLITLLISLAIFGGVFSIFYFGANNLLLGILIPLIIVYVANIVFGIIIYLKPSFKDAHGNLLK